MPFEIISLIFLIAALFSFYVVRDEYRICVLAVFSMGYVFYLNPGACAILLVVSAAIYFVGAISFFLKNRNNTISAVVGLLGIISCIGCLILFKYSGMVARFPGIPATVSSLVLPMGFSYYIFQGIGFLADIKSGKLEKLPRPDEFLLYQSFFAKFTSGPIEKAGKFFAQKNAIMEARFWDENRLNRAASYMVYGYFLKLMVANRMAEYTDRIFINPGNHPTMAVIAACFMYTFQIYCDFAGYSMIAVGIAGLFGIELTQNFNAPYMASGMSDFWRRWHVSLSSWLRDYIYIPLGGNRKGKLRKYLNTVIVFVVCGLWHGNGLNYLLWGITHGFLSVADSILDAVGVWKTKVATWIRRVLTFLSVSVAWIFFGSSSASASLRFMKYMILGSETYRDYQTEIEYIELAPIQIRIMVIAVLVVIIMDIISYYKKKVLPELILDLPLIGRLAILGIMFIIMVVYGVYGPSSDVTGFIYMNF